MLVIAGHVRLATDKREAAIAAAREMMEATRREAGCTHYIISADVADPGLFHIFEEWESEEALDAHFRAPHMATFTRAMGGLGIESMEVRKYAVASVGPVRG